MKKTIIILAWAAVLGLAVHLRTEGLYRGLAIEGIYHPDEPKQVVALSRYMQGKYLWRVGSLFYDGYPYGLNHVDEWILRPVLKARNAVVSHFSPDRDINKYPSLSELYYLSRALRVVYGVLALLLCIAVSRKLSLSKSSAWYAVLLLALAPISISVSHFATGDIGTDLFSTLTLLLLCLYAVEHKSRWLFLSGLAVGMSFACKYNGLLSGGAAGLYLLANLALTRDFKVFVKSSVFLVLGVFMGIVTLTPALLLDWGQTSEDIAANFVFIRHYGAGGWWENLGFAQKAAHILFKTTPQMLKHLGMFVMLGAAAGAIFSCRETIRLIKAKQADASEFRLSALTSSILIYPFIALIISLAGKPEVQPFHFSYLQVPFVLACAYGVSGAACRWKSGKARLLIVCLVFASICELGLTAFHDSFFWERTDNGFLQNQMLENVFTREGRYVGSRTKVRNIVLESESASVFRNRRASLELYGCRLWNEMKIAPLPSVPYPMDYDWIFMNGPAFPRNDRMFRIARESKKEKHLVFHEEPGKVYLGIRSGTLPVKVCLELGGRKEVVELLPNSQVVQEIETPYRYKKTRAVDGNVWLVPLSATAMVGDAYINVLVHKEDRLAFQYFGGDPDIEFADLTKGLDLAEVMNQASRARYIEGEADQYSILGEGGDDTEFQFPHQNQAGSENLPLPAGSYVFECDVFVMSESATVLMQIDDAGRVPGCRSGDEIIELSKGHNRLKYEFSKSFAPYQCCVLATALKGRMRFGAWKIDPIVHAITLEEPDKLVPDAGKKSHGEGALFGDDIRLVKVNVPEKLELGAKFEFRCGMVLEKFKINSLGEYSVFVHWTDSDGNQAYATGFSLAKALSKGKEGTLIDCGELGIKQPGEYKMEIGIVNGRTQKRLHVSGAGVSREERHDSKIYIGNMKLH